MTIEQYYNDKKPASVLGDTGKSNGVKLASTPIGEYITIPTLMYTGLVRDSGMLESVVRIMLNKNLKYDMDKVTSISAILDLPYEDGGDD